MKSMTIEVFSQGMDGQELTGATNRKGPLGCSRHATGESLRDSGACHRLSLSELVAASCTTYDSGGMPLTDALTPQNRGTRLASRSWLGNVYEASMVPGTRMCLDPCWLVSSLTRLLLLAAASRSRWN